MLWHRKLNQHLQHLDPILECQFKSQCFFLIQLPANVSEKAEEDGPRVWILATHVGDPDGVHGSWHLPGPTPVIMAILGVKQHIEDPSLCLSPTVCLYIHSSFKINTSFYVYLNILLVHEDISRDKLRNSRHILELGWERGEGTYSQLPIFFFKIYFFF